MMLRKVLDPSRETSIKSAFTTKKSAPISKVIHYAPGLVGPGDRASPAARGRVLRTLAPGQAADPLRRPGHLRLRRRPLLQLPAGMVTIMF